MRNINKNGFFSMNLTIVVIAIIVSELIIIFLSAELHRLNQAAPEAASA
jgi:hypothetical protein